MNERMFVLLSQSQALLRWPDLIVFIVSFALMIYIGCYCAKRNSSAESYFLASRSMPGWVVGFSVMATIISSMSFLANPGFAFKENWRYLVPCAGYIIATFVAIILFMPYFRKGHVNSAYEYLEKRFGLWARLYAALAFLLIQIIRIGIILYAASLAIQAMTGWPMEIVILLLGIIVAIYTIAGGLEAVIWTDLIQGITLIVGALICLPILIKQLPGGFAQIFDVANAHDKFSLGDMNWDFRIKGFWVMLVTGPFMWLQLMCTDQAMVQRYCAPKSKSDARKSLIMGVAMSFPMWLYFFFIGTALFVFYQAFPDKLTADLEAPEQILPFFILTEVPAGISGFVIMGLIAAAMSTLDSLINATAATVTTDFYKRIFICNKDEKHYLKAGRWFSVLFAVVMISTALFIHFAKTTTLNDIQNYAYNILGGGLLGLFMLGLLTKSVSSFAAATATITTFTISSSWVFFGSPLSQEKFPQIYARIPSTFWMGTFSNLIIFGLGLAITYILGKRSEKKLDNLTIWTSKDN
ncbi:MAG: sodium/solute symporter [Sedimentisphaerales bacterium]|nr:sodium/solute symporter [Sedimentisphaerales bacterium]